MSKVYRRFKMLSTLVIAVFMLLLSACGSPSIKGEITLVDINGQSQTISLTKLAKEIKPVTGKGGFMKSTGTIVGPFDYEGLPVADILAKIGGVQAGQALEVTATDGYVMIYGPLQVQGQVMTYTDKSKPLGLGQLQMILAYKQDGKAGFEGSPRIAYIGEGGPLSDGHFSAHDVKQLRIIEGVGEWQISIKGYTEATLDRATFTSIATCPLSDHPAVTIKGKDAAGVEHEYAGVPLWITVSMADGGNEADRHFRFNDEAARKGYTVRITSTSGQSVDLKSMDIMHNQDYFLAYTSDGKPLPEGEFPLRLMGTGSKTNAESIGQIAKIELIGLP